MDDIVIVQDEEEKEKKEEGAPPPRSLSPLDFLHFSSHDNAEEVEVYSDNVVDWNATKKSIEWNNNKPYSTVSLGRQRAIIAAAQEQANAPFDEPAFYCNVGIEASPAIELMIAKDHEQGSFPKGSYDTRSVLPANNTHLSSARIMDCSSTNVEIIDVEKSIANKKKNSYAGKKKSLFSPKKKRRRTIIICMSFGLLIIIALGAWAAIGFFGKQNDDTTPVEPTVGTGNDQEDNDDNVGDVIVTANPTAASPPTASPVDDNVGGPAEPLAVTYRPGQLTVQENGMILSQGLKSRMIAKTGDFVKYHNGQTSTIPFHIRPDGAATFAVPDDYGENKGGWVMVSNSEGKEFGTGGVGALTFDKDGNVIGYKNLLNGTTMNCSGGMTPWGTWVSCEEWAKTGQLYQVDPFDRRAPEKMTVSQQQGGRYEAFAYDDRDKNRPVFYVSEDQRNGPTRRWRPDPSIVDWNDEPWEMLHGPGTLDYLVLDPDETNGNKTGTYDWVDSVHEGRKNAMKYYQSAEGIDRKDNFLYMACKREKMLYVIDLDSNKYVRYSLAIALFDGEPDSVTRILNDTQDIMYFNEDLGNISGVHARNTLGQLYTILEGPGWSNEVTGLTFSPSAHHMYMCFQESGVMFEITREDGMPFYAQTLNVRYHNSPVDSLWSRR